MFINLLVDVYKHALHADPDFVCNAITIKIININFHSNHTSYHINFIENPR